MKGKNVSTKGKNLKQDVASAKDLTIELSEGRESRYHRLSLGFPNRRHMYPQGVPSFDISGGT